MSDKAKCKNCGKDMAQTSSDNWALYCTDEPCKKAFMDNVLKKVRNVNKRR